MQASIMIIIELVVQIELSGFEYSSAKARFSRGPICVQYLTVMNFKTIIYCQLLC